MFESARAILTSVFGYDRFIFLQRQVLERVLQRRHTLAVMPTGGGGGERHREDFLRLMAKRRVTQGFPVVILDQSGLLCGEPTAEHCHRRLVAEYLRQRRPRLEIAHLEKRRARATGSRPGCAPD